MNGFGEVIEGAGVWEREGEVLTMQLYMFDLI